MDKMEYEFTAEENQTVGRVATKMQHVSFLLLLFVVVLLAQFIIGLARETEVHSLAASIAGSVAAAALSYLLFRGANHLRAIVATAGQDMLALFQAFNMFRNFYIVLWILIAMGLVSRVIEAIN